MDDSWVERDIRTVPKQEGLGKVLGWLRGDTKARPVIVDGKRPYGVVDARGLFSRGIRHGTRVEKVTVPVPTLRLDDAPDRVADAFCDAVADYLPVRRDDAEGTVGAVTAARALDAFEEGPDTRRLAIDVGALNPQSTMEEAFQAFARHAVPLLPVVEGKRLAGVVRLQTAARFLDFEDQPQGRGDMQGEQVDSRKEPVRSEGSWDEVDAEAPFEEVRDLMQERGEGVAWIDGAWHVLAPAHVLRRVQETVPSAPFPQAYRPHYTRP